MTDQKKLQLAYVAAIVNAVMLIFVMMLHSREMWRVQREIFDLQEDVLSLHERVVKLQKATFGVVERSSIDKLPHRANPPGGDGR
jgi:cell division protein FtsL